MSFITYLKDALWNLVANKLRSFLSILWIVIWLFSVIFLMSIGTWAQQWVKDKMASLITNNISISSNWWYSQRTDENIHWYVKAINLTTDLAEELEYYFPELEWKVTYTNAGLGSVQNEDWDIAMWQFAWIPDGYIEALWYDWNYWNKFTESNFKKAENVAIVNKNIVDDLFDWEYAIGETLYYNNKKFRIVWVMDEESVIWQVFIPMTTYQQKVSWWNKISSIVVVLWIDDDVEERENKLRYFLMRKFNISHIDLAGFTISSAAAIWDAIDDAMNIFTYLLAAIWSISLLVWWIWVMNIMLVSVTERTREIWIRKAIWALNKDIITQFLIESVVVTLIWWIIAILMSRIWIQIINSLNIEWFSPVMTWSVVVLATTLTFLIGIISGIWPAKKAADLQPIDALRFE